MPRPLLGQHFLKDRDVVKKIVAALGMERGDVVFEIGPGHGELTEALADACGKSGAELFAVEKDGVLAEELARRFAARGAAAHIISGDAREVLTPPFIKEKTSGRPYRMVGNIPYYLTGNFLHAISGFAAMPARCVFMLQKEVAERITAEPPRMNRLAASVQFWAQPKIIAAVPKENFAPAPGVDSAVVAFETRASADCKPAVAAQRYYAAVRALFAQPRKTAANNLAAATKDKEKNIAAMKRLGIDPSCRPQNLAITQIGLIAEALF